MADKRLQVVMSENFLGRLERCAALEEVAPSVWARMILAREVNRILAPIDKLEAREAAAAERRAATAGPAMVRAEKKQRAAQVAAAKERVVLLQRTAKRILDMQMLPMFRQIVAGSYGIMPIKFLPKGEMGLPGDLPALPDDYDHLQKIFYHDVWLDADYARRLQETTGLVLPSLDVNAPRSVWKRMQDIFAPRKINVLGRELWVKNWNPTGQIYWHDGKNNFWVPTEGKTGVELLDVIDRYYELEKNWNDEDRTMKKLAFGGAANSQPPWEA